MVVNIYINSSDTQQNLLESIIGNTKLAMAQTSKRKVVSLYISGSYTKQVMLLEIFRFLTLVHECIQR